MKVSEKSLELNIGAELLSQLRGKLGLKKAYLRGLTQKEERAEGADFFAQLSPKTKIFAFQFKAPKGRDEKSPYKYTLVDYQHRELHDLGRTRPGSVFYVFPFYVGFAKLQKDVPQLMQDTWLLDAADVPMKPIFDKAKTRTVTCRAGNAAVNPDYGLKSLSELELPLDGGIQAQVFAEWYHEFRFARDHHAGAEVAPIRRRNPWMTRGLRVVIVPPS